MSKDGGPAFPGMTWVQQNGQTNPEGMTLRDYFAAKAMAGWLSTYGPDADRPTKTREIAAWAYHMADMMVEARANIEEANQ